MDQPASLFLLSCGKIPSHVIRTLPYGLASKIKPCCGRLNTRLAVRYNHYDCLYFALKRTFQYSLALTEIAVYGCLNMMPLIPSKCLTPRRVETLLFLAHENDQPEVVKYMLNLITSQDILYDITEKLLYTGCSLSILKYCVEVKNVNVLGLVSGSPFGKNMGCVRYLVDTYGTQESIQSAAMNSVYYNQYHILKYLVTLPQVTPEYLVKLMMTLTEKNRFNEFELLYHVYEKKTNHKLVNTNLIRHAIIKCSPKIVKFCLDNKTGVENIDHLLTIPEIKLMFE